MCVLGMDEKGNLHLYKFAILYKDEIIKRLINGCYNQTEPSVGPSTIGNSLTKLFSWQERDLQCKQLSLTMTVSYSLQTRMYVLLRGDEISHEVIIVRFFLKRNPCKA